MVTITYKTRLAEAKPYHQLERNAYLELLSSKKNAIYTGDFGAYLGREIVFDDQKLYFPFIDIDGDPKAVGDFKIENAIFNARLTLKSLQKLGASEFFTLIATGNNGFRLLSNILLARDSYDAFADFVKRGMPHIIDLKPTLDTDMPHQLFAYKGSSLHSHKDLVDRHSVVIPANVILNEEIGPAEYKELTSGRPDPDEVIQWVERILNFRPIADLSVLGDFGKKLIQYKQMVKEIRVNAFNYAAAQKSRKPIIPLEVMREMLIERGIQCRVEKRGSMAISFSGSPCPICKKTTANARAYPPYYSLRCWNTNCPAFQKGVPIAVWSGIKTGSGKVNGTNSTPAVKVPTEFVSLDGATNKIRQALRSNEDCLIVVTPGVGKSEESIKYAVEEANQKTVLYSCLNKQLKEEAYRKAFKYSNGDGRIHLLKALDELCTRLELDRVVSQGFSPTEILCRSCGSQKNCLYHKQREISGPGVFFMTHHMCRYIEPHFPNPDLVILDENLTGGFKLEDQCDEADIGTLLRVVPNNLLIKQVLDFMQRLWAQTSKESLILNGRKLTTANSDEDTILSILATQHNTSEYEICEEVHKLCASVRKHRPGELFQNNVSLKALQWFEGLISSNHYSYLLLDPAAKIFLKTKYLTPLGFQNSRIKILDATGDKKIARSLTGRDLQLVNADVQWKASTLHIKIVTSRKILRKATDAELERLLAEAISKTTEKEVMISTYKFLEKNVLDISKKIDPSRNFHGYHFHGARGINALEGCNAVIVLGLSYSNINASLQDACILFPSEQDEDYRYRWSDQCMGWELIQSIHRTRPVRKEKIELVLISSFWPPVLPPPDEVIDHSKDKNWKEKAVSALEPFVREFGFLNQDIGFLANVYIGYKESIAAQFRQSAQKILDEYSAACNSTRSNASKVKLSSSQLASGRGSYQDGMLINPEISAPLKDIGEPPMAAQDSTLQMHNEIDMKSKSNLDIYNIYIYVCLNATKWFSERIASGGNGSYQIRYDTPCITSNKQWVDLVIDFKNKYSHFEEFEIKLPHARGNSVKGVGMKKAVLKFYEDLSRLGITNKVNLQTYKTLGNSTVSTTPLPDGMLVFHLPEDLPGMLHVGFKDEVQSFFGEADGKEIQAFLHDRLQQNSILITNNGKALVKIFRRLGIVKREVQDIILNQRIIQNGEIHKDVSIGELFKQYELSEKPDSITLFSQMWQVWEAQQKTISELHLEQTVMVESEIMWIVAGMEMDGIGLDADGMIQYQDEVRDKLRVLEAEISSGLPGGCEWKDEYELKRYLNRTFSLSLTGTGKECLPLITDPKAHSLMESVHYCRQLKKTDDDIERYLSLVGDDDRVHDSIDQLGTKTGRITRDLQTVRKNGPMRTFFRPEPGYKFVISDYSQFEVRVLTGLSNDKAALDIFRNDKDFFSEVAAIGFNVGPNGNSYRKIVKPILHGYHNGRGMYSIHEALQKEGINISLDAVEDFLTRYQLNFPQFFDWLDRSVKDARQNGYAIDFDTLNWPTSIL